MKIRKKSYKAPGRPRSTMSKVALPALVAAGGGLAVGSVAALELGGLQVQSTLGQPLRASIAYALSPSEVIDDRCVAVRAGSRDLPGLNNASVRVSKGVISITSGSPVVEPMLSANIVVDCPDSAHVSRNYLLFINPRERPVTVARQSTPAAATVTPPARRAEPATRPVPVTSVISEGSRYQVQPGDSLSGIVRRIETDGITSATAMAAVLETNPGAFINGDPDRLKAGSWLAIPSFTATVAAAPQAPAAQPRDEKGAVEEVTAGGTEIYQGAETLEPDASGQIPSTEFLPEVPEPDVSETVETLPDNTAAGTTGAVANEPVATEADYSAAYADLVTGDVVVDQPATTAPAPVESAGACRIQPTPVPAVPERL